MVAIIETSERLLMCPRCGGSLGSSSIYTEQGNYQSVHCVNCGEYIDSVILQNRRNSVMGIFLKFRKKKRAKYE